MTGTSGLLLLLLMLTCMFAAAAWEACKAIYNLQVGGPNGLWFNALARNPERRLRELARVAAEAEIEKWADLDEVPSSEQITRSLRKLYGMIGRPTFAQSPAATI